MLPSRYEGDEHARYVAACLKHIRPQDVILDVGAGRRPVLPLESIRNTYYVALDIDGAELDAAPPGLYREAVVGSVETYRPELEGRFDLVTSFYVFEHVRSLKDTLQNCRRYLKDGGVLVSQFSARFSYFAIANQVLPHALTRSMAQILAGRESHTVFPAFYDRCWYSAVQELLDDWTDVSIEPLYTGAGYLSRKPFQLIRPLYLAYEGWTAQNDKRNLASHYLVQAKK